MLLNQQAALQNQINTIHGVLLQGMINPVVQPMPVSLQYLSGFAGYPIPQHPTQTASWRGAQGSLPPMPVWHPYPQDMMQFNSLPQQPPIESGFYGLPVLPPPEGLGLQLPFSPLGHYLQQIQGLNNQLQCLPHFCQQPAHAFIPFWAHAPFRIQPAQPVVINNINRVPAQPHVDQGGATAAFPLASTKHQEDSLALHYQKPDEASYPRSELQPEPSTDKPNAAGAERVFTPLIKSTRNQGQGIDVIDTEGINSESELNFNSIITEFEKKLSALKKAAIARRKLEDHLNHVKWQRDSLLAEIDNTNSDEKQSQKELREKKLAEANDKISLLENQLPSLIDQLQNSNQDVDTDAKVLQDWVNRLKQDLLKQQAKLADQGSDQVRLRTRGQGDSDAYKLLSERVEKLKNSCRNKQQLINEITHLVTRANELIEGITLAPSTAGKLGQSTGQSEREGVDSRHQHDIAAEKVDVQSPLQFLIQRLQQQLAEQTIQLTRYRQQAEDKSLNIQHFEDELTKKKGLIDKLKSELAKIETQTASSYSSGSDASVQSELLKDLQKKKNELEVKALILAEQIKGLAHQLQDQKNKIDAFKDQVESRMVKSDSGKPRSQAGSREAHSFTTSSSSDSESQYSEAEQLEKLKSDYKDTKDAVVSLQNKLKDAVDEINRLTKEQNERIDHCRYAENKIKALEENINNLEQQVSGKNKIIDYLAANQDQPNEISHESSQLLEQTMRELETTKAEIVELKQTKQNIEKTHREELEEEKAALIQQVQSLEVLNDELKSVLREKEDEIVRLCEDCFNAGGVEEKQEQISNLEKEKLDIHEALTFVQTQLDDSLAEKIRLNEKVEDLKKKFEIELKELNETGLEKVSSLKREIATLEEQLVEKVLDLENKATQVDLFPTSDVGVNTTDDLHEPNEKITTLKNEIEKKEELLANLKSRLSVALAESQQLKDELKGVIESYNEQLENAKEQSNLLRKKLDDLSSEVTSQASYSSIEKDSYSSIDEDSLDGNYSFIERQSVINRLKNELRAAQLQIQKLSNEKSELLQEYQILLESEKETSITEKNELRFNIDKLKESLIQQKSVIASQTEELGKLREGYETSTAYSEKLEKQKEKLNNLLLEKESMISGFENQYEKSANEILSLEEQLKTQASEQQKNIANTTKTLIEQIEQQLTKINSLNESNSALQALLQERDKKLLNLQKAEKSNSNEINDLLKNRNDLDIELVNTRAEIEASQRELKILNSQLSDYKEELGKLREEKDNSGEQIKSLKLEIDSIKANRESEEKRYAKQEHEFHNLKSKHELDVNKFQDKLSKFQDLEGFLQDPDQLFRKILDTTDKSKFGSEGLPSHSSIDFILSQYSVEKPDAVLSTPDLTAKWTVLVGCAKAIDNMLLENQEREKALKNIKLTALPKSLSDDRTLTGTEEQYDKITIDQNYIKNLNEVKNGLFDLMNNLNTEGVTPGLLDQLNKNYVGESIDKIDDIISNIEDSIIRKKQVITLIEDNIKPSVNYKFTFDSSFIRNGLPSYLNDKFINETINSELKSSYEVSKKSIESLHFQKSVSGYKALCFVKNLLTEMLAQEKKALGSKTLQLAHVEAKRAIAANVRSGIESLRLEKNQSLAEKLPDAFRNHWENYIDLALINHRKQIKALEFEPNKETMDRLKNVEELLLKDKKIKKPQITALKTVFVNSKRGTQGIDLAVNLLKNNDNLLADVLGAVNRADKMQRIDDHYNKQLYGSHLTSDEQRLALHKMLLDAYVRNRVNEQISPSEMLLALMDQSIKIDSKVVEIASERHSVAEGKTKAASLRNEKLFSRCLNLLSLQNSGTKSFWAGVPTDKNHKPCEPEDSPHWAELSCFENNNLIELPSHWDKEQIADGARIYEWKAGGQGLLDTFYDGQKAVRVREHVTIGERFVARSGSHIVFEQRKQPDGNYGKISVDLNGTRRELDAKVYLTYPNYVSPFNAKGCRSSIPLASTETSEVGELVCSGGAPYSEHYYRIVNQEQFPDVKPVLQCVAIGENNPFEEEFYGSVIGWLACAGKVQHKENRKAFASQAMQAYKALMYAKNEPFDQNDFKSKVKQIAKNQLGQNKKWFTESDEKLFAKDLDRLVNYVIKQNSQNNDEQIKGESDQALSKLKVILPHSLEEAKKSRIASDKRKVYPAQFAKQSLPADFDYHIDESIAFFSEELGDTHPAKTKIKAQRQLEKEQFSKEVFYQQFMFTGVEIPADQHKEIPILEQIKALRLQLQIQIEETMSYVEDCAILEQKVLSLLPESMKPCSIEDAKRAFGQHKMSASFAQVMMAYLTAESAKDISRSLVRDLNDLSEAMIDLERKRLRMGEDQFSEERKAINFKAATITRKKIAMHKRLIDYIGSESLDPQGIATKKYENTKGTILRDYQLVPARNMLEKVQQMSDAAHSDNPNTKDQKNRIICQLGTGFGKTELTKLLMVQACIEGLGAGYIGPASNVQSYNVDLSRHMRVSGGQCQFIDLKKIKDTDVNWWKNNDKLQEIHNVICGFPQKGGEQLKTKIPWTMSTADLAALLSLHDYYANSAPKSENGLMLKDIIVRLSGSSQLNRPLIIRDEFDTFVDSQAIANHCTDLFGQLFTTTAKDSQQLLLGYDFSIHNGVYLSASKDSDYINLLRADETSLEQLAESSNKDINTCELRAEQYLLKARWFMQKDDSLKETVSGAIAQFGSKRDLIFCDPAYADNGGCQQMAFDGINAIEKFNLLKDKQLKGHLYFKGGEYYCYSKGSDRYDRRIIDGNKVVELGCPLTAADYTEIMKTGGAGYITWLSEKRGYTAAQKNREPDTTAFVFRNLSALSLADRQQVLGRDRNIEPYSDHDNMVIVTRSEIQNWMTTEKQGLHIKKEALRLFDSFEANKDEMLKQPMTKQQKDALNKILISEVPFTAERSKRQGRVGHEELSKGFDIALSKEKIKWKALNLPLSLDRTGQCLKSRWEAVDFIKNKLFTFRAAAFEVAKDKIELEQQAEHASKHAAINDLLQKSEDFVKKDLTGTLHVLNNLLIGRMTDIINGLTIDDHLKQGISLDIANKICRETKHSLQNYQAPIIGLKRVNQSEGVSENLMKFDRWMDVKKTLDAQRYEMEKDSYELGSISQLVAPSFMSIKERLLTDAKIDYARINANLGNILEVIKNKSSAAVFSIPPTGSGIGKLEEIYKQMRQYEKDLDELGSDALCKIEESIDEKIGLIIEGLSDIAFYSQNQMESEPAMRLVLQYLSVILNAQNPEVDRNNTSRTVTPMTMAHSIALNNKGFYFNLKKTDKGAYQLSDWYFDGPYNKVPMSKFKVRSLNSSRRLSRSLDSFIKIYKESRNAIIADKKMKAAAIEVFKQFYENQMRDEYHKNFSSLKYQSENEDRKRDLQKKAKIDQI